MKRRRERDEKEKGERRILNFGHTAGHAIEKVFGITHGEAVSYGMCVAIDISVKKGLLNSSESLRIKKLLKDLCLPVTLSDVIKRSVRVPEDIYNAVKDALRLDKKKKSDHIEYILLSSIGNVSGPFHTHPRLQLFAVQSDKSP